MKEETLERIRRFTSDRDWEKYHTPENLAKSVSIEAGELLECFQWSTEQFELDDVKDELADVLVYCIQMAETLGL
ncbi:MAG: nucleotide pyrophosphohydrolase, partial [Clostridia bacterium]|nr:nucleotide pyrophosphohydrolase [Clostridia bacterium]